VITVIQKWRERFSETRDNESGAETIEIIVFLAIFVLGMIGVWIAIRTAAADKGQDITDCLNVGTTSTGAISC
jgi:hypothetical protein